MPDDHLELPPRKQDAIHRALLTGLLENVGAHSHGSEYTGVRGKTFHLFPGSSLFRRRPPWVMAAELVETTRVYARTVAPIHPLWIERAAGHLVRRTLSDPHWRADLGRVLAYEKVTLHGLTLVHRRKVHFGPIEPKLSREIFIMHAMVLGEYQTDAPFFVHNRRLIQSVQAIEAKARRRDVLVDPKAQLAFYDARIPQRVYTAREFENWRRTAELHNPDLLFMTRADLMLHPALGITNELYPDSIAIGSTILPLEYRFEPGDRADGITVNMPLAAVNQLPAGPFEWLVPGFRPDQFLALIRTLPKALRVKFVPAPEYAATAARELKPSDGPVLDALARYLGRVSGEQVRTEDFNADVLPEFLQMNFRIVDDAGRQIAMGRDLNAIRRRLGLQARASFAASPPPEYHRDGLTRWNFGDLPERIELHQQGTTLNGYPALIEAGNSVSLRLFDLPDAAEEAMRGGLRRLFMLQVNHELEYLERSLPDLDRLCLYYSTIGRCDDLKDDLLIAIANHAFFGSDSPARIRTRDAFAARAEAGWRNLPAAGAEAADLIGQTLEAYHAVDLALSQEFPPLWTDSIRDMEDQVAHLVYRGFIVRTPFQWLRQLPRYLRGLDLRFQKLADAGLTRDVQALHEIQPLWSQYKSMAARHREQGIHDPALEQYRWMLEELRISLFAQELKSLAPVSSRRLTEIWELVRK